MILFAAVIPFQDSPLQSTPLRFGGASLAVLPLGALALLWLIRRLAVGARVRRYAVWMGTVAYAAILTVVYIAAFGGGLLLVVRAMKYSALLALWALAIVVVAEQPWTVVKWAARIAFVVALIGVFACDIERIQWLQLATHFHPNGNMRPRGFSLEASTLGMQIGCLGLLVAAGLRRGLARWMVTLLVLAVMVYCVSKGGQVTLLAALGAAALLVPLRRVRARRTRRLLLVGGICGLVLAAAGWVAAEFSRSARLYASIGTRLTGAATALVCLLHNPLGTGAAGLVPAFQRYTLPGITLVERLHIHVVYAEALTYAHASGGLDVSTKTFLGDQCIAFGLPFLIAFVFLVLRLIRRLREANAPYFMLAAFVFAVIAISTYQNALGYYDAPFLFGAVVSFLRHASVGHRAGMPLSSPARGGGGRLGAAGDLVGAELRR